MYIILLLNNISININNMKKFGKLIQPKRLLRSLNKKNNLLVFGLVVALIFVALYFISKWVNTREGFSGNSKLYFFYADWCPHCTSFKPTWAELEQESLGVQYEKVDCSDNDNTPALATEYGVSGFPTIIFVNNGTKHEYKGNRSKEDIVSFVKSNQ